MKQSPANLFRSLVACVRSDRITRLLVFFFLAGLSMGLIACGAPASQPAAPAPTVAAPIAPTTVPATVAAATPTLAAPTAASPSTVASPTLAATAIVPTRPPATAVPTLAATAAPPVAAGPTPPCVQPTITLGTSKFRIESIARAADGSVAVPANTADVAYWVAGSPANYVFALSPVANNLTLKTKLKAGDAAKIVWGDCSTEEYVVKTIDTGAPNVSSLFDPSAAKVSVFIQSSAAGEGFLIKGGRPEPQAQASPAPTEASATQAEISFLATTVSADKKTLKQDISIKNTGVKNISLATKDISLTVEGAAPVAPLSVEPALPQDIAPGASKTFAITFPNPTAKTAVFQILDFTADLYF